MLFKLKLKMTSTQLPLNSQLLSQKTRQSPKKNSSDSVKVWTDPNETVKATATGRKKRLIKTRRTLRRNDSDSDSSSSGSETYVPVAAQPKKRKRRSKKKSNETVPESLATIGRAYGNNVSKQNVVKVPERPQVINKSGPSKVVTSREYGDFFSCQTGLMYLETNRIDMINSKGIKNFTDEYLKKLKKCEAYEKAHNVKPFASVRLELLSEGLNNNVSVSDVVDGNLQNVDVYNLDDDKEEKVATATHTEMKALSASALKTIEIIKKFKSGHSIEADLQVRKKPEIVVPTNTKNVRRQSNVKSDSDKNRSTSNENESKLAKQKQNSNKSIETQIATIARKLEEEDNSVENFITIPTSSNRNNKKLQSIKEIPSDKSIALSLGSIGHDSSEYINLAQHKKNPNLSPTESGHGYVLMKKVMMSEEKSVTIVDGRNRYDSKNRRVSSHYASPLPNRASAADNEKSLKSIETLYRTDGAMNTAKDKRIKSTDARRSQ